MTIREESKEYSTTEYFENRHMVRSGATNLRISPSHLPTCAPTYLVVPHLLVRVSPCSSATVVEGCVDYVRQRTATYRTELCRSRRNSPRRCSMRSEMSTSET